MTKLVENLITDLHSEHLTRGYKPSHDFDVDQYGYVVKMTDNTAVGIATSVWDWSAGLRPQASPQISAINWSYLCCHIDEVMAEFKALVKSAPAVPQVHIQDIYTIIAHLITIETVGNWAGFYGKQLASDAYNHFYSGQTCNWVSQAYATQSRAIAGAPFAATVHNPIPSPVQPVIPSHDEAPELVAITADELDEIRRYMVEAERKTACDFYGTPTYRAVEKFLNKIGRKIS